MALSPELQSYLDSLPAAQGDATSEGGGIGSDILWTLGLLTRPSKALWTGVDEFTKPGGSTWEGVKKGWYDQPGAKELADVVGLPEGKPEDDWAPWLGKEAARLVTSAVGDPLSYAFAPAKAAGIAKSGLGVGAALAKAGLPEGRSLAGATAKALGSDRLVEGFYGSRIGKVLKSGLPKIEKYDPVREKWWEIEREGSKIPIQEEAAQAQKALDAALANTNYNYADVYHALERPDEVGPDLARIADLVRPLQEAKDVRFNIWNTLKEGLDQETTGKLGGKGYVHMPHNVTDKELLKLRRVGDVDLATDAFKQSGREIKRFYYGDNPLVDDLGAPIVGKASDPRTQEAIRTALSKMDLGAEADQLGMFPDIDAMTRISPTWRDLVKEAPATLRDIKPIMPEGSLVENPVEALGTALTNRQGQINTLKLLDYLRGENLLLHTGKDTPQHLLKGMRQLEVPGFQTWATTPQLANWIENMAGVPTDWLGKSLQKARQTPMGQGLEDMTQWWKRNVLAGSPAYWTGNLVSDTFNRYASGQNPLELGSRMYQASQISPEMLRELQIRGLPVSSWAGSIADDSKNLPPSRLRDVAENVPGLNKIFDALGYGSEKWRDANNWLFRTGNKYTEAPGRVATALDYLAKNAPDAANPTAEMLDRAAAFAKEAMVDYGSGGMTATQRELQRLLVPFAGWQFGMPTLMAQQLMKNPQRLGRVSRTLDTMFTPLSPEEKAIADPYLHENAPVKGFADWAFPKDEKGIPQIMQLQRYLPWGNVEGMVNRPGSNTWSSTNPWLKAPVEMALNLSGFSGMPIDREVKGFGGALMNPITGGGPYSQSRQQYFGQSIPAGYEYLLNQSPAGRNVNTVNDLLRGLGLWKDPYKAPTSPAAAVTTLVTGGKFTTFDQEKQRKHRQQEFGETEKAISANMRFALNKNDIEGYQFYLQQMLDHVGKKSQKLGYSTPGS